MSKVELVANKDFSYMTRRLKAGDPFECSRRDAKVLIGIKLAREIREAGSIPPPPPGLSERLARAPAPVHAAATKPSAAPAKRRRRTRKSAAKKA